ncbi:flippase [Vibrio cyclitrophicus]
MFDKTIVKNIGSLFSIQLASYILPLITLPYLVRVLGIEGYGYLGLTQAICQYATLVVNYGFNLSATSSIAKDREDQSKVSKIFWNVFAIKVTSFSLCLIIVLGLSNFIDIISDILPIILACFVGVLGVALFPQWLFQGKEQLGLVSIARVISQLLIIPLLFVCVTNINDIWIAALILSLPTFIVSLYSLYLVYKRDWIFWVRPTSKTLCNQLVDGWHIFLSTAAISLYTTSVTVVLGVISGPVSVGYFSAADKLIKAILNLYGTISNAYYPRVNAIVSESNELARKLLVKLGLLLTVVATASSLLVFTLADFCIDFLFGPGHENTIEILKILSILPIIISMSNFFGIQVLIPFGCKKQFSKILILSGGASIFLMIPMIMLYGEFGAAISVVITELIVTFSMGYTVYKKELLKV